MPARSLLLGKKRARRAGGGAGSERRIDVRAGRRRLAMVWYIGTLPALATLVIQHLTGHYADTISQVWGWFSSTVAATLSMVTAALAIDAARAAKRKTTDPFFVRVTMVLSMVYLFALTVVLWTPGVNVETLHQANLFLGPLQGLVTAALGAFFTSGAKSEATEGEHRDGEGAGDAHPPLPPGLTPGGESGHAPPGLPPAR